MELNAANNPNAETPTLAPSASSVETVGPKTVEPNQITPATQSNGEQRQAVPAFQLTEVSSEQPRSAINPVVAPDVSSSVTTGSSEELFNFKPYISGGQVVPLGQPGDLSNLSRFTESHKKQSSQGGG